ncbi:hypothetical protein D5F01_LYC22840 [Larimichthys crocea]|uniref:Uncharacterized protein n=1 Tax=Larimichthys crocea TaxID=215358 RepID=A0A6G0HJ76_LARCR|nr:hypothetical protein D5F01_LYC22840 [Larimichthys crocea]
MGAVWQFQVEQPPPRLQRISVAATVVYAVVILTRAIFGAVYFNDCPQQPNIPNYLLGLALVQLLMVQLVTLPCESQLREQPKGFKACLLTLMCVFVYIWIVAGDVWIFSVYQPNYDATAADGLYCNKTLYTFALWTAVYETLSVCVIWGKFCKGWLLYVITTPVPANQDFYRRV